MFYFQFCKIAPLTYSTRSVHQTDISINEQEIDSEFDTKQERVRHFLSNSYYLRCLIH